jgi:hypothetical protein
VKVLIPIGYDEFRLPEVDAGVACQTIPSETVYQVGPRPTTKRPVVVGGSETENRNVLRQYADGPYTACLDSDVDLRGCPTAFACCVLYLGAHPDVDVVALDTKGHTGRGPVRISCSVWRTEILKAYTFVATKDECCCVDVNRRLKIKWLNQIWEIKRPDNR